jgi:dTDP-4-amino-4,6-dideoxygalactose transaminase
MMLSMHDVSGDRLYLSPPETGSLEREYLLDALGSNWVAPLGPHVDAFESELANVAGVAYAAALSSGTAALHLALRILDIGPGDEVMVSSFTFAASANAVMYTGATPVFVDADRATWQMDPDLLGDELARRAAGGRLPSAVIAVDLYGQCADYDRIQQVCGPYGIPVIEDAAEALGATYRGRPAGSLAAMGVFSFNGNKIITTSGGGMLVSDRAEWVEQARWLASQARDPAPHYEHTTVGYNYRMSNLLAAVGRAQLQDLPRRVARRRDHRRFYLDALDGVPGVAFMPKAAYGEPNWWLTCLTIDPAVCGVTREDVRLRLERENIESRPLWKPMHLQKVFAECTAAGGAVSAELFGNGLCLPSGSSMTDHERERVADIVRDVLGA